MNLRSYTGGFVQTNGYLIENPGGNILIDAPLGISKWVQSLGIKVDHVLLTHQHYDHVEDAAVLEASGARLYAFAEYSTALTLEDHARGWGLPISVKPYRIAELVKPGPLHVGGIEFQVAHVPGHATDGVIYHLPQAAVVFSGDTLFAGSIGRSDLPGGDGRRLIEGIDRQLLTLPAATRVLSGHGPETTIGREKQSNPYLE